MESTVVESLPQAARDAIDLNNEIAGRETGRVKRFLSAEQQISIKEKEREKERSFNALMRLMQNPAYAALHEKVSNKLSRAEAATERALEKLAQESRVAAGELHKIRDAAAQLPDGRKVYRSEKDGRLYTEDGADVTDQEQSVTGLTDASPSRERLNTAKDKTDALERDRIEIETYRDERLVPARDRLNDPDNPHSMSELEEVFEQLKSPAPSRIEAELKEDAPLVQAEKAAHQSAAEKYMDAYELSTPDMSSHFKTAKAGEPPGTPETPVPAISPKLP